VFHISSDAILALALHLLVSVSN